MTPLDWLLIGGAAAAIAFAISRRRKAPAPPLVLPCTMPVVRFTVGGDGTMPVPYVSTSQDSGRPMRKAKVSA